MKPHAPAVDEYKVMEFRPAPRHVINECSDLKVALSLVGPAPDLRRTPVAAKLWDLGTEGAGSMCPWERGRMAGVGIPRRYCALGAIERPPSLTRSRRLT
jgi:hypothetical protein